MIFHENRLLADASHEISYLIFFENWERCQQTAKKHAKIVQYAKSLKTFLLSFRWRKDLSGGVMLKDNYDSYRIEP